MTIEIVVPLPYPLLSLDIRAYRPERCHDANALNELQRPYFLISSRRLAAAEISRSFTYQAKMHESITAAEQSLYQQQGGDQKGEKSKSR